MGIGDVSAVPRWPWGTRNTSYVNDGRRQGAECDRRVFVRHGCDEHHEEGEPCRDRVVKRDGARVWVRGSNFLLGTEVWGDGL